MTIHNLKISPEYFVEVRNGNKTFEIRKNDRDFKVNDVLRLREWDSNDKCYSGKVEFRTITYITDYMQQDGYVVIGMI